LKRNDPVETWRRESFRNDQEPLQGSKDPSNPNESIDPLGMPIESKAHNEFLPSIPPAILKTDFPIDPDPETDPETDPSYL